ncbi:hypothetical protein Tco_0478668, partial [Tanacetum coccineum]
MAHVHVQGVQTNELFTPFKGSGTVFGSSWKAFKTLSLDELRSPDFNLLSDQEYSEEEVVKKIKKTMEQYISKTRADYGSGVARPKIEDNDNFELKGQFLKELRTNTFSGLDHEDANEHIEKFLEIVDLFHILNITIDQIRDSRGAIPSKTTADAKRRQSMEDTMSKFMSESAKRYEENSNLIKEIRASTDAAIRNQGTSIKTLEIQIGKMSKLIHARYVVFGRPFQGGGYRTAAPRFYQRNNANPSYQERRQSMEDTMSKFMSESAKRYEENSNLIKEIRASTDASIRNQGTLIKTLEIQIEKMSKVLQERGFGSLPSSSEVNPRDQVKSISTTIEADSCLIRRIGSSQYVVSTRQNRTLMYTTRQTTIPFLSRLNGYYCKEKKGSYGPQFSKAYSEASHINNSIPRKEKDPRSFTLPCFINKICFDNALVDLGASVSVMPLSTYLNLGLGELAHTKLIVELADRTVKYPKGIAKNVLVGIVKFVFPVDFIILDMPEDIKVPLILGRPFLSTARAKIDVYKRKITLRVGEERIVFTSVKLAGSLIKRVYMLSLRERMKLDLEARLMGETLVINRSLDPFF